MCDYCEQEKEILSKKIVDDWIFNWQTEVASEEIIYSEWVIFIDRGYLRFVDKDETQCMDHGKKLKINYCLFCGEKLKCLL